FACVISWRKSGTRLLQNAAGDGATLTSLGRNRSSWEAAMTFVTAVPELLATAATDLEGIGSALSEAATAAATPTTKVLAAAADEVSTAIAALFSGHAEAYQAINAEAMQFHADFVRAMTAAAGSYAATELASASPLQPLIDLIN